MLREGPYSRYPVMGRTPDDVLGFIHIRDLMPRDDRNDEGMVKDIIRDIPPLPGSNRLLPSLSRTRKVGTSTAA